MEKVHTPVIPVQKIILNASRPFFSRNSYNQSAIHNFKHPAVGGSAGLIKCAVLLSSEETRPREAIYRRDPRHDEQVSVERRRREKNCCCVVRVAVSLAMTDTRQRHHFVPRSLQASDFNASPV